MAQGFSKLPLGKGSAFTAAKRQKTVVKAKRESAKMQAEMKHREAVKLRKRIENTSLAKAIKSHDSLSIVKHK